MATGSLATWDPYSNQLEGGIKPGQSITGQFVYLGAGPPFLQSFGASNLGGTGDVVYPLGVTQNLALSSNRAITRIFEIGSNRSYFIHGRTISQLTLARVWVHGPSLLRILYAWYEDNVGVVGVPAMEGISHTKDSSLFPYRATLGGLQSFDRLHNVRIPPGYENAFLNLASDLFSQPMGILMLIRDNSEQNIGAFYLEQCFVPTHTWVTDSQGLIVQESVGLQFERIVPIRINAVSLVSGLTQSPSSTNVFRSAAASGVSV